MADRIFAYIDGESHYIRTEWAWSDLHGPEAGLTRLRHKGHSDGPMVLLVPSATIFWTRTMGAGITRSVYFTSVVTDEPRLHQIKVDMRGFDLEAHIVSEKKQAAERRKNKLRDAKVIEKAKGVDIALAVRMVEDAQRQTFDRCHLYTSDADFLPAIQAVKAHGKHVYVFGYKDSLAEYSELLHVPDQFVDLGDTLRNECELCPIVPQVPLAS